MTTGADTPVPRSFAAKRLGVSPHVVSMWVLRGWVDKNGDHRKVRILGKSGRERLYRWGDLMDAESDTRNNRNSARNPERARPATGTASWAELDRKSPSFAPV